MPDVHLDPNSEDESEMDSEDELEAEMAALGATDEDAEEAKKRAIYNSEGLHECLEEIGWEESHHWNELQVVSAKVPTDVPDVDDDLNRELSFYNQALTAAKEAGIRFLEEKKPFRRPDDYYAEMVKSDQQMMKIKGRLLTQSKNLHEAEQRRKQAELKRYGKKYQVEVMKERMAQKKKSIADITKWRKDRARNGPGGEDFPEDLLDDGAKVGQKRRRDGGQGGPGKKRMIKDEKYGYGGPKRKQKQNDAMSAADMQGYRQGKFQVG
eukprot:CAMPEP_0197852374 /NCGR_PEP_ID=MMETSP1438-20131217/20422_1 /TAXON_ID=1461541 /ORGANISM="Pterosperma sp., Strain CCMP1384" /LENGTH=266 /DNA_ID=CAMNT_0043466397 /DNA_START=126 /DNA_END=922 /DNA_ORIENTATION=-